MFHTQERGLHASVAFWSDSRSDCRRGRRLHPNKVPRDSIAFWLAQTLCWGRVAVFPPPITPDWRTPAARYIISCPNRAATIQDGDDCIKPSSSTVTLPPARFQTLCLVRDDRFSCTAVPLPTGYPQIRHLLLPRLPQRPPTRETTAQKPCYIATPLAVPTATLRSTTPKRSSVRITPARSRSAARPSVRTTLVRTAVPL